MTQFHASVPMERVHLDFLGPLPETKSGNSHVLMMVDQFTKWVECIPLPSHTAEVTARAAINEFFSRFGYPFQIFTDQGRNFESRLFKAVCDILHIHKTRTTPYRPSANGHVERFNRTLMDAVRCYVDNQQDNWDEHISQLAGAIRSSVNRSTGFSPNQMMLGRKVNQPVDLVFQPVETEPSDTTDDYVARLKESILMSHDIARKTLKVTQDVMKRDYDLRVCEVLYKIGDIVYVLDTAVIKGKNRKLSSPWKGPGIIVSKISPYVYKVKLRKAVFTTNHDRLKLCNDRDIPPSLKRCNHRIENGEDISDVNKNTYCLCGGPEHGFMIRCDTCDEWYHGPCVNITKELADTMQFYYCPACQEFVFFFFDVLQMSESNIFENVSSESEQPCDEGMPTSSKGFSKSSRRMSIDSSSSSSTSSTSSGSTLVEVQTGTRRVVTRGEMSAQTDAIKKGTRKRTRKQRSEVRGRREESDRNKIQSTNRDVVKDSLVHTIVIHHYN